MCEVYAISIFLVKFYFGMQRCSISPNIREGLLETFYGVYEKDPDKVGMSQMRWRNHDYVFRVYLWSLLTKNILIQVLQAMIQMGVLVPTGDMTAVRRTAQFFLNRFYEFCLWGFLLYLMTCFLDDCLSERLQVNKLFLLRFSG